jgi:hypothetical protein
MTVAFSKILFMASATVPFFLGSIAHADQILLTPIQDTTLIEENPDYSNGAGVNLFAGPINSGFRRRALMKFDVSAIPAGSQITGVTLRILANRVAAGSGVDDAAALHRLTASWGEGTSSTTRGGGDQASPNDATWLYRFYGGGSVVRQSWSVAGGDFVATASTAINLGSIGHYVFPSTPQLAADVQSWLDTPVNNFGLIILVNEGVAQTVRRIGSRETFSPADQPTLTVTYTSPAATDADVPLPLWSLALLGVLLMGVATRGGRQRT